MQHVQRGETLWAVDEVWREGPYLSCYEVEKAGPETYSIRYGRERQAAFPHSRYAKSAREAWSKYISRKTARAEDIRDELARAEKYISSAKEQLAALPS